MAFENEDGHQRKSLLTGHIGKIPVWVIGLGLAALFIVFIVVRNFLHGRSTASQAQVTTGAAVTDPNYVDPTLSSASNYGLPPGPVGDYLAGQPTNAAYPVGLTPQGIPGPVTNQQWARLAGDQLIAQGDDPSVVNTALAKYISGGALAADENAIINLAIQQLGEPPEGVIPVQIVTGNNAGTGTGDTSGTGTPAVTQAPAPAPSTPAARRYVYVAKYTTVAPPWNSTLSGIAAHYGTTVDNLAAINHISNVNLIYTGQKIYIDP